MTKKKKVTENHKNISNEQFEAAKGARERNIMSMEDWLLEKEHESFRMGLQLKELQIKLKYGLAFVNPTHVYDNEAEYQEHLRLIVQTRADEIQKEIERADEGIEKTREALVDERTRLKLINDGIPAWFDEVFEKHNKLE